MSKALKTIQKQFSKKEGGFMGQKTDKRAKKVGLIPGVDSPYQWKAVGDVSGTTKESF